MWLQCYETWLGGRGGAVGEGTTFPPPTAKPTLPSFALTRLGSAPPHTATVLFLQIVRAMFVKPAR